MTPQPEQYDVVVLGAGPAGENVADRTRAAGLSTVIVESQLVGGECSYWACIPSKALLRPGSALAHVRALPGAKQAVNGGLDTAAVLAYRDEFTSHWHDDGQVEWLRSAGIDLVRGHGRLAGERAVLVDDERLLTARHAVAVCTGSRPALPHIPGLAEAHPWTSRDATSSAVVPPRLAVVGGGVVAVEMAAAWRSLGSEVTVLARGGRLLGRMESFAGELVAEGLREAGVDVRFHTEVTALHRDGPVTLTLGGDGELVADQVLYATGRLPRTDDIGMESIGLSPGNWLDVDDSCLVKTVQGGWLYAVGDVNHRNLLTHQGKYQARIAGAAIVARARGEQPDTSVRWGEYAASADTAGPPQVVFTEPEAAAVGLTLDAAERAGLRVRAIDYELGQVSGASLYTDGYQGRARIVLDLERRVVVGATFVGPAVAELLHSATVAVVGEVPIDRLWHAVPAFPTISEVWLRLLETCRDSG
ncbi:MULTISPECIES: dihydrolipoyl dehydrogenase family protein [Kitasatospora]|uniref:NAD(P)/FAD-dependent oxidoreductase n=1 Tax=Kitasatospora cystarginea TaxID=58350 RepID=A0ABP5QL83_9ACTN